MASQMTIPSSSDTLFIRGFANRHHVDEIRDFFTQEGGRNSVEFFKETLDGTGLFIALKFESRSIAKDVLNRFDGYEVLGDRITISWYKDIRKARAYESMSYQRGPMNQRWPQDRYDHRQGGYGRGRGQQYRAGGQRSSWYQRGSDHERSRRYTRSSSRSHSRSGSPRSRGSRSVSRSSSRDDRPSRSRSDDSRERSRKRRRSGSDASPRRHSRKNKTRASSSSTSPNARDRDSRSESGSLPPPSEPVSKKKGKRHPDKKSSTSRTPSASRDSKTKDVESTAEAAEVESSDVADFVADDGTSPQPVPPPAGGKSTRTASMRSAVAPVSAGKKNNNKAAVAAEDEMAGTEVVSKGRKSTEQPAIAGNNKVKKLKGRMMEESISDEDEMFGEKSAPSRLTKEHEEFLLEQNKKSGKEINAQSDSDMAASPPTALLFDDNGLPLKRKSAGVVGKNKNTAKDYDLFDDDGEPVDMAAGRRHRHEGGGRSSRSAAGANKRGSATSAVGLPFEKMQLVRQKKEEIEKAYRQDCETFATVTKMLISKEPSLEDKIQNSLRENLKEIGHRCIQEMRDFIERLKDEDLEDV